MHFNKRICQESAIYDQAEYYHSRELYLFLVANFRKVNFIKKVEMLLSIGLPLVLSDFGQKLVRPIVLLLTIHFLWTLRLVCIQGQDLSMSMASFLNWHGWNLYFYTLNPAHKLDYLGTEILISPSISFGMRLTGGIILFQIIKATRKYLLK